MSSDPLVAQQKRPELTLSGESHHEGPQTSPTSDTSLLLGQRGQEYIQNRDDHPTPAPPPPRDASSSKERLTSQHLSYMICSNVLYFVQIAMVAYVRH